MSSDCPIKCSHVKIVPLPPSTGMSNGTQEDKNNRTGSGEVQIPVNTPSLKLPPGWTSIWPAWTESHRNVCHREEKQHMSFSQLELTKES